MDVTVFIPTRGRTSLTPITAEEVCLKSRRRPLIVCPPSEALHYGHVSIGGSRLDVLECPLDGVGPTRQWILENSPTRGVLMLDDDLYFSRRRVPESLASGNLERCSDLEPMFRWVESTLDLGFVHGGISARQGNQNLLYPEVDCIRVNNAHFFDREEILDERIRFDALPVMEDFYVTLSLLLRGHPNRVNYEYCWSQRASGFRGGCSLYRTKELQAESARRLAELFPIFVKVVEKESKSGGELFSGTRTDVNISWLRAWENRLCSKAKPEIVQLRRR